MNKIEVVIEHFKLDRVKGHLNKIWVQEITISEENGFNLPKTKIQIIANNDQVDDIMLMFTSVYMEWGSISVTFRPDQPANGVA
ncbi:MAG: P-II family nitrogen regulator [Nitrospinales bacterium]